MNRIYSLLLLTFTVMALLSCAHGPINTTAEEVAANTQVHQEGLRREPWVSGPKMGSSFEGEYYLRGNLTGRNINYYQLVYARSREITRGGAFYNKTFDKDGQELPMVVIRRQAWPYEEWKEEIGIRLTRDALGEAEKEGLTIKIVGRRDSPVVEVPAFYVTGFLSKVDQLFKQP